MAAVTNGCRITGTILPGLLLSSEVHIWGLESLMAVTSLFIDMAGNAPFLSAVRLCAFLEDPEEQTFCFTL